MGFLKPVIENQNSRLSRTSNEKAEGTYNYKNTENIFRWKGLVILVLENADLSLRECRKLSTSRYNEFNFSMELKSCPSLKENERHPFHPY